MKSCPKDEKSNFKDYISMIIKDKIDFNFESLLQK